MTAYRTDVPIGMVDYVEDPEGRRTSYGYDYDSQQQTGTGRVAWVSNPLGKKQYFSVDYKPDPAVSERRRTWGDTPYPVELHFDLYGRQTDMYTYRGGSGWNGATWPGSPGTADNTHWKRKRCQEPLFRAAWARGRSPTAVTRTRSCMPRPSAGSTARRSPAITRPPRACPAGTRASTSGRTTA